MWLTLKTAVVGAYLWEVSSITSHLSVGDALVIMGAVAFSYTQLRAGQSRTLRSSNNDLTSRNAELEAEKIRLVAEIAALEQQPNLDKHAELLAKMLGRLEQHDSSTKAAEAASQLVFKEIIGNLREIRTAVVPPEHLSD